MVDTLHEHNYVTFGSAYWKRGDDEKFNQDIDYITLYCTSCGDTKEIIVKDCRSDKSKLKEMPNG